MPTNNISFSMYNGPIIDIMSLQHLFEKDILTIFGNEMSDDSYKMIYRSTLAELVKSNAIAPGLLETIDTLMGSKTWNKVLGEICW